MKNPLKRPAIAVLLALLAPLSAARCVVLEFDPTVTINFDNLAEGASLSTIGWTGGNVASGYFTGTTPGSGNPSTMAVTVTDTTNRTAISPAQTPAFTSNHLYFSAWVRRGAAGTTSGARFQLTPDGSAERAFAGFGLHSSSPYNFAFYGDTDPDPEVTALGWIVGDTTAAINTWYELALVVELNPTTPSNSLGYLYYRKADDAEYTLLPEFDGVQMSWFTSEWNASDFAYWRITQARSGVQVDNLSAGMVVPEPSVGMLFGAGATALALLHRAKRK